jgi:hypothetical protein
MVDYHTREKISHSGKRISVSHWLTDSNKKSKSSLLLAFSIIKNILPLVEGVMVDDHTLEKEYQPHIFISNNRKKMSTINI